MGLLDEWIPMTACVWQVYGIQCMLSLTSYHLFQKLTQLGVERLIFRVVPSVLETWTDSFSFAKMTNFERSQFLDYTFLDFQGTSADLKPVNQGSLTIHGLHLNVLFLRKMSFFTDKKEIQRSATALRFIC
ncbi:uncharacterized protein LOC109793720 isoform X3 [Cajanus cajan]|uniref:uncharacterized protein LOC109793720 isoform X3 n=1 Tax=Cajanus cajan TaxID=3821 RepID=UPI00098D786E|nr:uncharacterized protein LOC109793720 isoform X3 [Cajanus cajan]